MKAGDLRKEHEEATLTRGELATKEKADMAKIAKLFDTPDGEECLELLFRRFGVLGRRVRSATDTDLIVGQRDGEAAVPLFICQCLKASGKKSLNIPL